MNFTKDQNKGTWLVQFYYTDWQGIRKKKFKRGFRTKADADQWAREFLQKQHNDLDMRFAKFLELYYEDMENRLRETTMRTKKYIIDLKILPYFEQKPMNDIKASDIRAWQNMLLNKGYSQTYLKTVNNQLSAIFNYADKYYDMKSNPCKKAGSIGKSKADEMKFWTKAEYLKFLDAVKDKPMSYMAFQLLYWTGMRIGELMALTFKDIDFEKNLIYITKSFQRISGRDVITEPKTPKSIRNITIPKFVVDDLNEYTSKLYGVLEDDRLFKCTKSYLTHEMLRGIGKSEVQRIRLHDLRHSHASLLVEMGFTPLEIAERLGHEKIETTLNTYSHLYPNKQKKLAERLELEFNREEERL